MRISGAEHAAWAGAPAAEFTVGDVAIAADAFYLTPDSLSVAGGRRAVIAGTTVLSADEPVTLTVGLASGAIIAGEGACAAAPLPAAASAALAATLASSEHDAPAPDRAAGDVARQLTPAWEYDAGGEVRYLRAAAGNPGVEVRSPDRPALPSEFGVVAVPSEAGHVAFLGADGSELRRMEAGVAVNDVCVADADGDGAPEVYLARADSTRSLR